MASSPIGMLSTDGLAEHRLSNPRLELYHGIARTTLPGRGCRSGFWTGSIDIEDQKPSSKRCAELIGRHPTATSAMKAASTVAPAAHRSAVASLLLQQPHFRTRRTRAAWVAGLISTVAALISTVVQPISMEAAHVSMAVAPDGPVDDIIMEAITVEAMAGAPQRPALQPAQLSVQPQLTARRAIRPRTSGMATLTSGRRSTSARLPLNEIELTERLADRPGFLQYSSSSSHRRLIRPPFPPGGIGDDGPGVHPLRRGCPQRTRALANTFPIIPTPGEVSRSAGKGHERCLKKFRNILVSACCGIITQF